MPTYQSPGVYVEAQSTGARPIQSVGTSIAAFVGVAPRNKAHVDEAGATADGPCCAHVRSSGESWRSAWRR